MVAALVTPEHGTALPVDFEPIINSDGQSKNCSERNAAKRLLPSIRAQYPKRDFIVLEDAIAANGPHVSLLDELGMDFIIGARPTHLTHLFEEFDKRQINEPERIIESEITEETASR